MQNLSDRLTVALITKNEEAMLEACLQSIAPLNARILLIDSGSNDKTLEIAARYGAECYVFPDWQGFGKQRNLAHQFLQTDWVLWLDADERLTPEICTEIAHAVQTYPADGSTVFAINRLTYAYGKPIYHGGWYPDYVVRMYAAAHTRYNQNLVHESVIVPNHAQTVTLKNHVHHITYTQLNQQLQKTQQYTLAWAKQNAHRRSNPLAASIHALFAFFRTYILKRGFLDGMHGLLIAVMNAIYTFVKYTQLWVLNQHRNKD